jgi:RNA polymerase sigma factor (TIGR02999 family)
MESFGTSVDSSGAGEAPEHRERDGDPALDAIVAELYESLRELARRNLGAKALPQPLDPTDLLHDCYLRLRRTGSVDASDQVRFRGLAARVLRNVVVDAWRRRRGSRGGGDFEFVTLHEDARIVEAPDVDLVALDEALKRLASLEPRPARVVELRFFGGLSHAEIAEVLEVSVRTVEDDWSWARAWLRRELRASDGATS